MQIGDLVWVHKPKPPSGWTVPESEREPELAIYLGEKTFDEKYTCSMVHFLVYKGDLSQPRPVQTNLLEVVSESR